MKKWTGLIAGCIVALAAERAHAAPVGDYDGDGLADLAIIDADEPEDKTTVFVRLSSNGNIQPYVFFPFGDWVISGNFFGNGRTYPGTVANLGAGRPLQWTVKTPSGGQAVFNYGLAGDSVPNQGDLDCDGVTDLTVVRDGTAGFYPGFRVWNVALSSQGGAVLQTVFGLAGDEPYIADVDGDGCGELMVLRAGFNWFSKELYSDDYTYVQWGVPGDIPLLPTDVNGDGAPDYMVARVVGNRQIVLIRFSNGTFSADFLGSSSSIPLVGNFFGANTFGWFERSLGRFGLRTLAGSVASIAHGNSRRGIVRPDGTEVTESESGVFGATATANDSDSGDVRCDQSIALRDGAGGFKNNPENSRGTLKIMFPKSYTGNIDRVTAHAGGQLVDTLTLGGLEWGNRERWYGRKSLGSYPNNLLIVATLDDGRNACVTLPDPEKVYD